jgi:phage shock protein PspC (stress-responsive transcriptional regulator)
LKDIDLSESKSFACVIYNGKILKAKMKEMNSINNLKRAFSACRMIGGGFKGVVGGLASKFNTESLMRLFEYEL